MNERIQELAEQCATPGRFDVKKFAELIVSECVNSVMDCSVEYCTRPQIARELKEHFGVE